MKILVKGIISIVLLISALPCISIGNPMAAEPIKEILSEHERFLMSLPGVVGVGEGICKGEPCIKVFVIKRTPERVRRIPSSLDGYPVIIEETGEMKIFPRQ
jgi:hypothetical protein